jgi:hypothetical protein
VRPELDGEQHRHVTLSEPLELDGPYLLYGAGSRQVPHLVKAGTVDHVPLLGEVAHLLDHLEPLERDVLQQFVDLGVQGKLLRPGTHPRVQRHLRHSLSSP